MESRNPCKITFKLIRKEEENTTTPAQEKPSSSSSSPSSSSDSDDEILQAHLKSNQLVLYDPTAANTNANTVAKAHEKNLSRPNLFPFNHSPRVLPSIGAFTVQCANCFKWRLIPSKEKYEQIRESILERPFYCKTAREWRDGVSCDDPADINQDGSRLWAIDKPNIAQPPPGWQRLLRIRSEGGSRFADVYYEAPTGKRLRSMVEVDKYLYQHPEYLDAGVTLSQFSFQTPKPLQENYVRKRPSNYLKKRPSHLTASRNGTRLLEPSEDVRPLALTWVSDSDGSPDLQLGRPASPPQYSKEPQFDPFVRPTKKRATTRNPSKMYTTSPNYGTEPM